MTPARSLAASVVALGFASTLTAPTPALAAPAPCERAERYAAQSGAEVLRIEKLEVRTADAERPTAKESPESATEPSVADAAERVLGAGVDPTVVDPADSDTLSEGIARTGEAALGVLGLKPSRTTADAAGEAGGAGGGTGDSGVGGDAADEDTGGQGGGLGEEEARRAISGLVVGEARSALIGNARVKSAGVARAVNGKGALGRPLLQQAPPSHDRPAKRSTAPGQAGPVEVGAGELAAHARWADGMACGNTAGEAARSEAAVDSVQLLGGSLVRTAQRVSSSSSTGLESHGDEARSVASATIGTGTFELAGGKVRVRILRAPTLTAGMSTGKHGAVRYEPAVVEVSGEGVERKRLQSAGEHVDITLRPGRRDVESTPLSGLDGLAKAADLPLPPVPGLPPVAQPKIESSPAAEPGTRVRIALGDVRRATKGHAIAARATAIKVTVGQSEAPKAGRGKSGYGDTRSTVSLAMGVGLLEAAAVAPENKPAGVSPAVSGAGGGLPITGPRLDLLAYGGVGLLVAGVIAVLAGVRRRRPGA